MPRGRTKVRLTVAINPAVARALDAQARSRDISRSAAAEEAFAAWLQGQVEGQREVLDRLSEGPARVGQPRARRGEAVEAMIGAGMVLEALRYQFAALREISDDELLRRAVEAQKRKGGRDEDGAR